MAHTKFLASMMSVGLLVGCGDDGMPTTAATGQQPGTMTTVSTSIGTSTSTMTDTTASTMEPTGTSEGTSSTGSASTGTTADPTTGMVTATMGTTTPDTTDAMTTDIPSTSTDSTSTDTTSTSSSTTDDTSTGTTEADTTTTTTTGMNTTEDMPCDELNPTVVPVKPNVMLVLDKSGSMINNTWDHDNNPNTPQVTRWHSLYAVVNDILTNAQTDFRFGLKLFPAKNATDNYDATACTTSPNVEVTCQAFSKNLIMNALPAQNALNIQGGTPAAAGMTAALNHLKSLPADIPRAVLLVTDGAANCGAGQNPPNLFEVYDQTLHTIVGNAWTQDGIPTYVIGIAIQNAVTPNVQDGDPNGINPYVKLNELATAGGKPKPGAEKFYSADNQLELDAALDAIIADAISCVIDLNPAPGFPEFTKVKVGNNYLDKINDCASENGWKYVNPNGPYTAIELCGTACSAYQMAGGADVEYFCTPG